MALKALMLRKKIEDKKIDLDELRKKSEAFTTREAELEKAIVEAKTDEEKEIVEKAVDAFDKEKSEHGEKVAGLEKEIGDLEADLRETEKRNAPPPATEKKERRKDEKAMNSRTNFFGMTMQERDAFIGNDEVRSFLQRAREFGSQKRAISGAELLIPNVVLDLIRENIEGYSKLYKHVRVRNVPGKARQIVMGAIPEGVWTEMCATLNELSLSFASVEVDGYKVGGYIAVCNALMEDSDIALATEIINALGQSIGFALDKAILYGTGTKMPLGIVTRLAQTAAPADAVGTMEWKDLHESNMLAVTGKTDTALFKALVEASGAAKGKYSAGDKFWAMNNATYTKLVANALTINAVGAIVSGQGSTLPVIGGAIETLEFIPDDVIIGGYGDMYLLVERAGASLSQSEHVRFIEDQTIFKGTARYDGTPVIAEGFVAIGINGNVPTAGSVEFAEDAANA